MILYVKSKIFKNYSIKSLSELRNLTELQIEKWMIHCSRKIGIKIQIKDNCVIFIKNSNESTDSELCRVLKKACVETIALE